MVWIHGGSFTSGTAGSPIYAGSSLARRGDVVVTAGGIVGKITKVLDDNEVMVELAEGVSVKVIKATLSDVRTKPEPANDQ